MKAVHCIYTKPTPNYHAKYCLIRLITKHYSIQRTVHAEIKLHFRYEWTTLPHVLWLVSLVAS